jgi:hypothetical protein
MAEYVSLTVADEALRRLEDLSTPLCSGALRTFVQVNEIEVGVGFVRSPEMRASTDACLTARYVGSKLERNLTRFPTLDAAPGLGGI